MSKQSSIKWLYDQMSNIAAGYATELNQQEILEKAKAMHKEEIMDAFQLGKWDWADNVKHGLETKDPAEYYKETFA